MTALGPDALRSTLQDHLVHAGYPPVELRTGIVRNQYSFLDDTNTIFVKVPKLPDEAGYRQARQELSNIELVLRRTPDGERWRYTQPYTPDPFLIPAKNRTYWATVWRAANPKSVTLLPHQWTVPLLHSAWNTVQYLHRTPDTNVAPVNPFYIIQQRIDWYRNPANTVACDRILNLAGMISDEWESAPSTLRTVMCHGDPHIGNVLFSDRHKKEPTAVLCDWESVRSAPAEWDLACLYHSVVCMGGLSLTWRCVFGDFPQHLDYSAFRLAVLVKAVAATSYLVTFPDEVSLRVLSERLDVLETHVPHRNLGFTLAVQPGR